MNQIATPDFTAPAIGPDGRFTSYIQDLLFDLWYRTGQEAGSVVFSILSGSNYSFFFEDSQGNLYITNNARYNEDAGYWERIDETRTSWMLNFLGVSEPLEEALGLPAQTAGFWIAQPSIVGGVPNPAFTAETPTRKIKDGFTGAAGGWERGISVTQFGDQVVRGYGIELDGNGNVPFGRVQSGFASTVAGTLLSGDYRLVGVTFNAYLDDSGSDRAKREQARLGIYQDDTTEAPLGVALLWSDAEDPSAGDDEVGTTGPTWDQTPILFIKSTGDFSMVGDGTNAYFHPHDATTTARNVGFGAQGNTALIKSGNVFAATADANGIFYTRRGVRQAVTSIDNGDSPYSVGAADHLVVCDAASGAITVNLPALSGNEGRVITVKKTDNAANNVTLDGDSSETIDGATTYALTTQYDSVTLVASSSEWHVTATV